MPLLLAVAGCGHVEAYYGARVTPSEFQTLVPGSSQADAVREQFGNPTLRGAYDPQTWIYVEDYTERFLFFPETVKKQTVTVFSFDPQGLLTAKEQIIRHDPKFDKPLAGKTPTLGVRRSLLVDVFGNIGSVYGGQDAEEN